MTNNQSILERIDSKFDDILAGLRLLERKVRRIEKDINDNDINVNKKFIKVSKFSWYYIFIIYISLPKVSEHLKILLIKYMKNTFFKILIY